MKLPRRSLAWIAVLLIAAGAAHTLYRHAAQGVAWLPGATDTIWDVEAMITLDAHGESVRVRLAVPASPPGFRLVGEHTASPGYGLAFEGGNGQRWAQWTIREASGPQVLYYRAQFEARDRGAGIVGPESGGESGDESGPAAADPPPEPDTVTWGPSLQLAATQVLEAAYRESADPFSLAAALSRRLREVDNQNAQLLLSEFAAPVALVRLLHQAEVPARVVRALELEDGRRRQTMEPVVQVFDGDRWRLFDPREDGPAQMDRMLLWEQTGGALLEVEGGEDSAVSFSMIESRQAAAVAGSGEALSEVLFNLSIYSLPISEQAVFRSILLLPLGALVVVFARVVIGLETSGTFMPVLIALTFLEMALLPGLVTFLLVIGGGLLLRQAMAHLNLLLVARVSVVIVCVIGLIALLSVVSFHLGVAEAISMPFFPMIIMAWTIERLSILWEEEGPRDVFKQGGGSLVTAIGAYLLMQDQWIQYWMFNFLGLQLVVLALIILLGSYTGYRLTEIWRFRPFWQHHDA